jgi:adenylate cyclase
MPPPDEAAAPPAPAGPHGFSPPSALSGPFRAGFDRALLASERQRAGLMAGFFAAGLLVSLAYLAFPVGMADEFRLAFLRATPMWFSFYAGAALYEGARWAAAGRHLRTGHRPGPVSRYVHAAVEVSLPTLVLAAAGWTMDPVEALALPPALFYLVLVLLTTLHLDWRLSLGAGFLAAAEYLTLALVVTAGPHRPGLPAVLVEPSQHVARAGVLGLAALAAAFVAARLRRQFADAARSAEERARAVSIFGQHVSPQVAERLLGQAVELGPEVREVCVMFLDVRGFTRFADGRSPAEVMDYLNALFGPLIDVVNAHHGIINKFLGDGFMAVFGAPVADGQSSRNAVRAAVAVVRRVGELAAVGSVPPTEVGIGLHAGRAVTGNVGSAARKEYTVIGDVVNLASRVEQLNKQFDSRVLVTGAVWSALDAAEVAGLTPTPLGPVAVRGQDAAVELYRLA